MISAGARKFAKFSMRATPKHSLKAFSCSPSQKGFSIGAKPASIAGLAARLPPIPAAMSSSGVGLAVPSTLFTRSLSSSGNSSSIEELEETTVTKPESSAILGSTIEASENLHAILGKLATGTRALNTVDSSRVGEIGNTISLVDFHASWCGPCHVLGPILEAEVKESKAAVLIKVDVDEAPKIAEEFQITSLPTVLAIVNGKVVDSFVGSRNKAFVKSFIANLQKK